ncbi:MAG TPA: hypothetical protein VIT91_10140 [Chthoniobacterales bacterium]
MSNIKDSCYFGIKSSHQATKKLNSFSGSNLDSHHDSRSLTPGQNTVGIELKMPHQSLRFEVPKFKEPSLLIAAPTHWRVSDFSAFISVVKNFFKVFLTSRILLAFRPVKPELLLVFRRTDFSIGAATLVTFFSTVKDFFKIFFSLSNLSDLATSSI